MLRLGTITLGVRKNKMNMKVLNFIEINKRSA